jgi:hypothetical protein
MEAALVIIESRLLELMSGFDTKEAKPRTYTRALDDVVMTTAAEYVTKATSGFLPSAVPAHKCLKVSECACMRAAIYLFDLASQLDGCSCSSTLMQTLRQFDLTTTM